MGGLGSGRTGGWPTVEGCCSLVLSADEIMRPIRNGMRKLGMREIAEGRRVNLPWRAYRWTRHGESDPWAVVQIRLELSSRYGTAWFRYDVDHYSRRTGPQEYRVSLVTTPCQFGGLRWWWICPATRRRVQKLYLSNGGYRFLSRGPGANMLAYASQRHGAIDRCHARSRKLYRRLGAEYSGPLDDRWRPRPKGMHWQTYNAICDRLERESSCLNRGLEVAVERLMQLSTLR
jgi:hypothetical protein